MSENNSLKVFISHSWSDKSLAEKLANSLSDFCDVWMDYRKLRPGDAIQQEIDPVLLESDLVLLVWSANAAASSGVARELETCFEHGRRIIPCIFHYDDCGEPDPPLEGELAELLAVDFHHFGAGVAKLTGYFLELQTGGELERDPRMVMVRELDSLLNYTQAQSKIVTTMSKPYVFISYSRQDREFVEELTNALSAAGVETWTDVSNIAPGQSWQDEIERGLLGAEVLLYVASRNTSTSQWMERELRAFTKGAGRVIPLIVDAAGEKSLPNALRQFNWADFTGDFGGAMQELVVGLASLRQSEPLARPAAQSKGYVFISYASEDEAFVEELKAHMKGRGYTYWDFRESQRNYQVDYTIELEGVISDAEAILSVVSPDWKKSPTCFKELHFAKEVHRPVFLLRVRDPGPTFELAGMTFIDFTGQRKAGFSKLDSKLDSDLVKFRP